MINWQFRSAPLPRPNPHLLREDRGMRANFVQLKRLRRGEKGKKEYTSFPYSPFTLVAIINGLH